MRLNQFINTSKSNHNIRSTLRHQRIPQEFRSLQILNLYVGPRYSLEKLGKLRVLACLSAKFMGGYS